MTGLAKIYSVRQRVKRSAESRAEEHELFAKEFGLRYVSDNEDGIVRKKRGRGFVYVHPDGRLVRDRATLARIRSLVIPPAYRNVWICADPRGHLQATGLDDRGRKQYRYHPKWREVRDANKFHRMIEFGHALPVIRRRTRLHLAQPGLSREKVLATLVQLLERTLIRVGNEEYARENGSYGLSTMKDRHVEVKGSRISFEFRGKRGIYHNIDVTDRSLARIVRGCQDLPGQDLFQWIDEQGERHPVTSTDVNAYLQELTGRDFTAKDFRTWAGTTLAACALAEAGICESEREAKRKITEVIKSVSSRLGNTPAICRKCYVHPDVLSAYREGELIQACASDRERERAVLRFLERRARRQGLGVTGTRVA